MTTTTLEQLNIEQTRVLDELAERFFPEVPAAGPSNGEK